jgi:threonine/homoserine/homoserine lactone efflux protein
MLQAIGELLPLAIGVSISPLPIIAMIVLLMSPRARVSAPAFVLGWVAAVTAALIVFAFLSGLGVGKGGKGTVAAIVKLVLGTGLLFLAYKEWRARPAPGESGQLPHWLDAVENMGPLTAGGFGFAIYAANPKNLTVGIAAGVAFASAHLPLEQAAVVCAIYTLLATSTVILPVTAFFVAEKRARPWLDEMRDWLTQHNSAVMAVLLLVIGTMMIGKGVTTLAS